MGCSWHWVVAGGTLFKLTCLDWKVGLESMHFKIGRVVIHGQLVCPTSSRQVAPLGHVQVLFDFGACFRYSSLKKQLFGSRARTESACERIWAWRPPPEMFCWVLCGQES